MADSLLGPRPTSADLGETTLGEYLGHLLVVLMDLEAETLSELKSFYAPSIYIWVSGVDVIQIMDLGRGRVEIPRFFIGRNRLRYRCFRLS